MTDSQAVLLKLVQSALWNRELELKEEPTWSEVREQATMQAVLPLCFTVIQKLPNEHWPKGNEVLQWLAASTAIKSKNVKVNSALLKVHEALRKADVEHCFMKGQTVAARYDNPLARTPGDIDFVVNSEDYERCLAVLDNLGKVDYKLKHEHHGMAYVDGVQLEPHFKVHNYQSNSNDKNMDRIFRNEFPARVSSVRIDEVDIPVFDVTFESVFLISHIVNHVYEEGVGLRQLCDWVMLLRRDADKINWLRHSEYLNSIRMMSSFRILGYMCEKYLGLPESVLKMNYTRSEQSTGDKLMSDILEGGNFGRGKYVFDYSSKYGELKNYLYVTKRAISFYGFCPSEARMWPVSKLLRYAKKSLSISLR